MKKLTIAFLTSLFFLTSTSVYSADYETGRIAFTKADYAGALVEWQPLAEQGDTRAQFNLGFMYKNGEGIKQNYKAAVKWYTLAAEQGYAKGQTSLGFMYDNGLGVTQNYETAARWYILAAEQGHAFGQFKLSLKYLAGEGVEKDNIRAYMWASLAKSNGDKRASKLHDFLINDILPSEVRKGQELTNQCIVKKYKEC